MLQKMSANNNPPKPFSETIQWAQQYKKEDSSGGFSMFFVIGFALFALLFIWWLISIFTSSPDNTEEEESEDGEDENKESEDKSEK